MIVRLLLPALALATLAACGSGSDASAKARAGRSEWPMPNAMEGDPTVNETAAAPEADPDQGNAANAAEPARVADKAPTPVTPPRPGAFYHAGGTEPFWRVTVYGGTLMLERPDAPTQHFAVRREGNRYTGEGVQMALGSGPCSNGMSDRAYPEKAQVALAGSVLKGCGGEPMNGDDAP